MKINADIYVKDVPGQLVSSLEPISTFGGNIVGVVHNREQLVSGRIVVNVTFNMDSDKIDALKKEWKSRDVIVAKMGEESEIYSMDYMIIGDIKASYIEKVIDDVSKTIDFDSVDVSYSSKISSKTRTAMISANVHSRDDLSKLNDFLSDAARKSGFVYIRGVSE
jgi:ACT domain-containing protein